MKSLAKEKEKQLKQDIPEQPKKGFGNVFSSKKKEHPRAYRPPGYTTRRVGLALFWLVFAYMLIVSVVSVLAKEEPSVTQGDLEKLKVEANPATTLTAVQYTQKFAREYFTWQPDDQSLNDRVLRLAPFLAEGLDKQAGLEVNGLQSSSKYLQSEVSQIEEKGKNRAYITLQVQYEIGIPKEVEAPDPKDETKKIKTTQIHTTQAKKFFVVPVLYEQGTYGIYELPKFTYVHQETAIKAPPRYQAQEVDNPTVKQNIRNFLVTFFNAYAQDPKDKLAYILEDPEHVYGLQKTMNFKEVKKASIYPGSQPNQYIVDVKVVLEDPASQVKHTTDYLLTIEQKENRYRVLDINQ